MSIEFLGLHRQVRAGVLDIAYYDSGPTDGPAVILLHGFPYDVHAYTQVAPALAALGCRVVVPYLRGYGPTRFVEAQTPRSGEQAALGADLLALLDALALPRALLAGYDWGSTAACVVAALWPERCTGLVSLSSYKIQNIATAQRPAPPENEARFWYQYYFHSERGRAGLEQNRRALCRMLWRTWSPHWPFDDATFDRSAAAFDNPDFVDVVVHSYRHRHGATDGDPAYASIEDRLARLPEIGVPAMTLDGAMDGVVGPTADHAHYFTGWHQHRIIPDAGHNLPQERPVAFVQAIVDVMARSKR